MIATEGGLVSTPDVARAVERVIGERWTRLTDAERDALVAKAQAHRRDVLERRLVPAPRESNPRPPPSRTRTRTSEELPHPPTAPPRNAASPPSPHPRRAVHRQAQTRSTPKTAAPAETAVPVAPVDPPLVRGVAIDRPVVGVHRRSADRSGVALRPAPRRCPPRRAGGGRGHDGRTGVGCPSGGRTTRGDSRGGDRGRGV